MSDNNSGFIFYQLKNGYLYLFFGERIQCASGFIQDYDRCIFEKGASNGNTLSFTAG